MAEATTKYKVAKRLSEKQRMKIVKDTAGRAAECYTFATSKNKDLTECLRELVCDWDDKQERGEFSGDAAIEWREKVRAEGRAAIDKAIEHLSEVAKAANEGQWLPDDVDVLGVQADAAMLIDTLHELWAQWAEQRVECTRELLVPVSWPRLTEPVEESEDESDAGRPLRKALSRDDSREEIVSDDEKKAKKRGSASPRTRKAIKEAGKAEAGLRALAKRLDKKAHKSGGRRHKRSDSSDGDCSSRSSGRHHKFKKAAKKSKKEKKKKASSRKSYRSKKSRRGRRGSPSDSSGSGSSGSSNRSSGDESRSRSRSASISSGEERRLRRLRRAVRDIQRQQAIATVNVAQVVRQGSREKLQLRAKPFSWSGQTGKQGNVLIQYASMIYFSGNQPAVNHGENFVRDHRSQGLKWTECYQLGLALLDILMTEDSPSSLWECAVGEAIARFCYGYEASLADFVGPPTDKNKAEWTKLEQLRVDRNNGRLAHADEEARRAAKLEDKRK